MAIGLTALLGLIIGGITAAGTVAGLGVAGSTADAQKKSMKEQQIASGAPSAPGVGDGGPGGMATGGLSPKKKNIVV